MQLRRGAGAALSRPADLGWGYSGSAAAAGRLGRIARRPRQKRHRARHRRAADPPNSAERRPQHRQQFLGQSRLHAEHRYPEGGSLARRISEASGRYRVRQQCLSRFRRDHPDHTAALIPGPNNRTTALMNASLTQFLSPQFGAFLGKINTIDSSATEFYGDYRTQFQNAAFNFPMSLEQVPISTFGGGLIAIPQEDILLSATVLGANGKPDSNDPGEAFNGVMVLGTGELKVKPWGLAGHHAVNIEWNDKKRFSLNQDPSNLATLLLQERFPRLASPGPVLTQLIARFFPTLLVPGQPANRETSSWAVTYAFDHISGSPTATRSTASACSSPS